jgi:carbonic anhydrase/acetyltransferase-like protein (isoleucine patch superfamily)
MHLPFPQHLAEVRSARGLLTPDQLAERAEQLGFVVLDPYSVLLSRYAEVGTGTVLYPGAVVECDARSTCVLGRDNTLHNTTRIAASDSGSVRVGDGGLFGEGGTQIRAAGAGTALVVGDGVRLMNGAEVTGTSRLGDGTQILGPIQARTVDLASGMPHTHPDPDQRGAVLKGLGRAQGICLARGEVVNGLGDFAKAPVERQRAYHPDAPGGSPAADAAAGTAVGTAVGTAISARRSM